MNRLLSCILLALSALAADLEADAKAVLARRCLGCHNSSARVAGLSLADRESATRAITAADPARARLLLRVVAKQMPPGNPLPPEEIANLRQWLEAGAPWTGVIRPPRERVGPDWWSLQPLRKNNEPPTVPADAGVWQNAPIDRFLFARLKSEGLKPSAEADRITFIRRATFDLIGLPPTPAEIDAFVGDTSPRAYEKLIDRLLESPHYGERWGRHWLDVVRFGESFGYERNLPRSRAWPYRDWVIQSFNADKPFNRMIVEQLAGDQVAAGDPSIEAATGFLVAGIHDDVTSAVPADILARRFADLDDMVTATGAAFLGLSVNCARCHDHKFDPIEQKDYYRLQSAFAGVQHSERAWAPRDSVRARQEKVAPLEEGLQKVNDRIASLRSHHDEAARAARPALEQKLLPAPASPGTDEKFAPKETRFVRMTITRCVSGVKAPAGHRILAATGSPMLDEVEIWTAAGNVARSARVTTSAAKAGSAASLLNDGKFDSVWTSAESQRAQITFEFARSEKVQRIYWSNDRVAQMQSLFQNGVPADYRFEGSLDGKTWFTLADSNGRIAMLEEDRQTRAVLSVMSEAARREWNTFHQERASLEGRLKAVPALPAAYLGTFRQPEEPAWLARGGNPMSRGGTIAPASVGVLRQMLPGFELDAGAPEAERRLALARWLSDNRHALVSRVIVNRLWHYHFGAGIVGTPNDFGQNGEKPSHPELLDWLAQRLIAHGWRLKPMHREIMLSAAYRQASTFQEAAARHDRDARLLWRFPPKRLEAEAVRDAVLAVSGALDRTMGGPGFDLFNIRVQNVAVYTPRESWGPETLRRTVYARSIRAMKEGLMGALDCPDSTMSEPKRATSTTPLQLLSLLNSTFTLDQAQRFAQRVREQGGDERSQAANAIRLALGRVAPAAELDESAAFIRTHGLAAFTRALFASNEFVFIM